MTNIFRDKRILVTGGTGSIGSEIVRTLLRHEPKVVRVLSNDENGLFSLREELCGYSNLRFLVGDVKDKDRLRRAIEAIDIIFHAAALKHVPLCEYNPYEAVKVNVLGTQNLLEVAIEEEVEKFITISTDKAVNPINVMGATKLLAEKLTIAANEYKGPGRTAFSCVRFGNVLGSRGSVVPLFMEQIRKGGPVTITDGDMTRFGMSISKAVGLTLKAAEMAQGGEIFIFKMSAFRVGDLTEVMIEELAPQCGYSPTEIELVIMGKRAGEKNHEELMSEDEAMIVYEKEDMFVIPSPWENLKARELPVDQRTSRNAPLASKEEIREMLKPYLAHSETTL